MRYSARRYVPTASRHSDRRQGWAPAVRERNTGCLCAAARAWRSRERASSSRRSDRRQGWAPAVRERHTSALYAKGGRSEAANAHPLPSTATGGRDGPLPIGSGTLASSSQGAGTAKLRTPNPPPRQRPEAGMGPCREGAALMQLKPRGRAQRSCERPNKQKARPAIASREWECGSDLLSRAVSSQVRRREACARWALARRAKRPAGGKRNEPKARSVPLATIERAKPLFSC